ncbi:hypothetical protein [Flavobacterium sp. GCM10027622]|uniref:hypothetical protein n=1 Tax=unclassified Flavobacterium TaxID=196869 RepID=UPI003618D7F2
MKLENFKSKMETAVLKKSELKHIVGGEYGDVDWAFWGSYFSGNLTAHQLGRSVGATIATTLP